MCVKVNFLILESEAIKEKQFYSADPIVINIVGLERGFEGKR